MRPTIETVQAALALPLPGLRGQARMIPANRMDPDLYAKGSVDCRRAAVLFLLYPHRGELHTLLTVRPDHLPDHPGQVAFPGGGQDDERETVEQTALREAQEEVGIRPELVKTLGRLTHLYIPPSHFCIQIVVGYAATRPTWQPNPHEIAGLLEIPLAHFFDPANIAFTTRVIDGQSVRVPYYALDQHVVWGATAMTIAELVTAVEEAGG
ncbi:MAG: CoA pyrophosphatase [Caldilineales bacterium]|nr:CoA pyrophosphatase [Caldilineales bacterium]